MAHLTYHPELNEKKPQAQGEMRMSHNGRHYFLDTPLELRGMGIRYLATYKSTDLTPAGQRKVGWHQYRLTERAATILTQQHDFSEELLLD